MIMSRPASLPVFTPAIMRAALIAASVGLGGIDGAAATGAADAGDIGSRVDTVVAEVFARGDYQQTLPGVAGFDALDGADLAPPGTIAGPSPSAAATGPLLPILAQALRLAGWAVVAVACVVGVVWVVSRMALDAKRPGRRRSSEVPSADGRDAAATEPNADAAAALAADGRFGEAIHALLLTAFSDLGRRLGALPPSTTGREVVRAVAGPAVAAPPVAAEALHALVAAVERSRFAARTVGAADYALCRAAYQRFAAAWSETP